MQLLSALDISIVATALPRIVAEFNAIQNISWIIAAYALAMGIAMPVYGRLVDKYGSRRMFFISVSIFLASSVLCGFAFSIEMLSAARVMQGLGAAGMTLMPITILSSLIPERSRPKYIAPMISVWTVASVAGPVLGALLTDTVGWRWVFWINAPIGLVAILLALTTIPRQEKLRQGKLFDPSTLVLFVAASAILIFALHSAAEGTQSDFSVTLSLLAAAFVATAVFIWRTLKSKNPLIPIRAFNNRGAITVLAIGTLAGASLFPLTNFVPTLLQMGFGVPAWAAGLALVPLVFGVLFANILSSRRLHKTGRYYMFYVSGTAVAALGMFAIYYFAQSNGVWLITAGLAAAGLGVGLFGQFTVTLAQSFSKSDFLGSVTSTVMVTRDMASSIVVTVSGGIFGFGVSQALSQLNLPEALKGLTLQPSDLANLDPSLRVQVESAYFDAFHPIFLNSAIAYIMIFVLAVTMPKLGLKAKLDK